VSCDRTSVSLRDLDATERLGLSIASLLKPGDILLLTGELGAGKTTLVKSIAKGLGIDPGDVTSPTFTLIHEYQEGRIPFVHADLYRLGEGADILETGLEEYMEGGYAVAIEWAEYMHEEPAGPWLRIELRHASETARNALLEAGGTGWKQRLDAVLRAFSTDTDSRRADIQAAHQSNADCEKPDPG